VPGLQEVVSTVAITLDFFRSHLAIEIKFEELKIRTNSRQHNIRTLPEHAISP
jgi:hypothetical protein